METQTFAPTALLGGIIAVTGQSIVKPVSNPADGFAPKDFIMAAIDLGIKVRHVGSSFKDMLKETVGSLTSQQPIFSYQLLQESSVSRLIPLFGGLQALPTPLAAMLSLLKQQPQGEEGILLTNGQANCFFIRTYGELFVVSAYWHVPEYPGDKAGWCFGSCSLSQNAQKMRWRPGRQFFLF